jgi:hypothetical protein
VKRVFFVQIKFVEVATKACTTSGIAEGYFAQTAYFPGNHGRIMAGNDVNLVVPAISTFNKFVGRKFLFK